MPEIVSRNKKIEKYSQLSNFKDNYSEKFMRAAIIYNNIKPKAEAMILEYLRIPEQKKTKLNKVEGELNKTLKPELFNAIIEINMLTNSIKDRSSRKFFHYIYSALNVLYFSIDSRTNQEASYHQKFWLEKVGEFEKDQPDLELMIKDLGTKIKANRS